MNGLIGYSGFVGGNLLRQFKFDKLYNSSNISDACGKDFGILVCCGIPAQMWLANHDGEQDWQRIKHLVDIIKSTRVDKLVLVSTVAVYKNPVRGANEATTDAFEDVVAYGKNRRRAEVELEKHFGEKLLIVRLPALFGHGLKKNFIYDLTHRIPRILNEKKFQELSLAKMGKSLSMAYFRNDEGFWELQGQLEEKFSQELLRQFENHGFTALNFTHSQSRFQFYCLDNLWHDIVRAEALNLKVLNICSVPVTAAEVAKEFFNIDFVNDIGLTPVDNDMWSRYAHEWGKKVGQNYLYSKEEVFDQLRKYLEQEFSP